MVTDVLTMLGAADPHTLPGAPADGSRLSLLIPLLPALGAVICAVMGALRVKSKAPAWVTVGGLGVAFGVTVAMWQGLGSSTHIAHGYDWIRFAFPGGELNAGFSLYIDSLTALWMLFVTGLATLIALYASEYMSHDVGPGYCRFFFAFNIFVAAMSCLVMADNLLLLYLGWEGVGLASYLLIGYFYTKPSAVAAAKKAFIVNRIGDLGLALAVFACFVTFGSVEYADIFGMVAAGVDGEGHALAGSWQATWIPIFLMIGAFGKSAQLPLYVWLPDAMEGPTPVSALIHAATMVTAGVYLIARMYPVFLIDESRTALTIVAWVGALTALLAATIGMAQFDIKRIMAYSTVSQLGYMFAGLGVLTSVGAAFHVFTHAFFKATLFLACGAVMHGFAGQLDLRKLSGLWRMRGWFWVSLAMLIGCLNLAGFPFTAGYFSKDMILAEAFVTPGFAAIGVILLLTAGLTAYYTFRVFFRVFVGPVHYEPGDEHHEDAAEERALAAEHHHAHDGHSHDDHHDFHPHAPGWAINFVMIALGVLSIAAAGVYFMEKEQHGWVGSMVHHSTAHFASPYGAHGEAHGHGEAGGTLLGFDPHKAMYYVSAVIGLIGILAAWWLHYAGRTTAARSRADGLLAALGPIPRWAQRKWYVDELYEFLIRKPLWVLSNVFGLIDKLLVDGIVNGVGLLPRGLGLGLRPSQNGLLHGYAAGMAGGLTVLLIIVWMMVA